jgi:hypothetical protein
MVRIDLPILENLREDTIKIGDDMIKIGLADRAEISDPRIEFSSV